MKLTRRRSCGCFLQRGVTLLELLAVVLIIGLVASMAVVGFRRSLVRTRQRQAVETLLLAGRQCRILANRSNQRIVLRYDAAHKTLLRSDGASENHALLAEDLTLPQLWVARSSDHASSILFYPNGTADTWAVKGHDSECHLTLGLTGQTVVLSSLSEAKELVHGVESTAGVVAD